MPRLPPGLLATAFVLTLAGARLANASCGAERCQLDLRGPEEVGGRFSFGVAYQFANQDQPRIGTGRATIGEIPGEHNEVSTRTESWLMTGRARLADALTVHASVAYLDRLHRHEHEHHPGTYELQEWSYRGLGDLTVLGTYTPGGSGPDVGTTVALQIGFKAPTGRSEVEANADGDQPEPSARPGTGSWDGLAGLQVRRWIETRTLAGESVAVPFSIGVLGRVNGTGTDDFRAGNELQANLTGGWALSPRVSLIGQINSRWRVKDESGHEGIEENSGGSAVLATPGLRAVFGRAAMFGYLQFRLYERVNGIQITSPLHVMVGTSYGL